MSRRSWRLVAVAAVVVLVWGGAAVRGQGPSTAPLKALVTSNTPLTLGSTIGVPVGVEGINDRGDYLFGDASAMSALLLRRAGATEPEFVFQSGGPVPGIPHSQADLITGGRINQAGMVAFQVDYFDAAVANLVSGIFTYDGGSLAKVVGGAEIAPDSGGAMYGRMTSPVGLAGFNDVGDVLFTAPLVPAGSSSGTPARTTIFFVRAGGSPVRIAGIGDSAPGTGGTINQVGSGGVNNLGEVLFSAGITGGSGGFGVFKWTRADGVKKIVAHGDAAPGGGTINLVTAPVAALNNGGQVAILTTAALFLSAPGADLVAAVSLATLVPAPLDTKSLSSLTGLSGFNDPGAMLFRATLSGTPATTALFRCTSPGSIDIVAYSGQQAPVAGTQAFSALGPAATAFNNAGDALFYATLSPNTPTSSGLFEKPSGGALVPVMLNGQAAPAAIGGTYAPPSTVWARLRGDGSAYFESDIRGGTASSATFLATASGIQTLVTSADPLPPGANVRFRTLFPTAAGDYVGFIARHAGGTDALMVHNTATGVTSKVVAVGDPSPLPGGAPLTALPSVSAVYLNAGGSVVFGGTVAGVTHLFVWNGATGLRKLVGPGDSVPGTTLTFTACALPGRTFYQINAAGQVAFKGTYAGGAGLFVAATGQAPVTVARSGDSAGPLGTFTATFGNFLINDAGQVAFSATTSTGKVGLFVWTSGPAATLVQVAATGDSAGGGTISAFTAPAPAGFNTAGVVTFYATLTGGQGRGLFAATTSGVQAIALNGDVAPAGGSYAFAASSMDVRVNDAGDILFQAPLVGGTANSGHFLRRASTGAVEAVALQGEVPLGASYPLATISGTLNSFPGEFTALGPAGKVFFSAAVDVGGTTVWGVFRYDGPGSLGKILLRNDAVPGSGGGTAGPTGNGVAVGASGRCVFRLAVVDGAFGDSIYATGFDTVPPIIAPHEDVTAEATSPAGAVVTYVSPTWTDDWAGTGIATCTPASGSLFALGATQVTCTATDGTNAAVPVTFSVRVVDAAAPTVVASADPAELWPASGRLWPVTISGSAVDSGSGVAGSTGTYEVVDQYGLVQPRGTFTLGTTGDFSFVVKLEASRRGSDKDGRTYVVRVIVRDLYGNATTTAVTIVVPRDLRK